MRIASPLVLPVAVIALLAGCSGPDPQPTATQTVTASPSASASASPSASATPQVDPTAPDGQCADDALSVDVVGGDAGDTRWLTVSDVE